MGRLAALIAEERPAFPLWTPVLFGVGVQIYFALKSEPSIWTLGLAAAAPLAFLLVAPRWARLLPLATASAALLAFGFALAGLRANLVAAPVLERQMDAAVEGVVRAIGRTRSGRPRLVLDRLAIFGADPEETPRRAQVALLKEADLADISPGDRVSVFAHLGPPGGPVEPGGFDYRRMAWFAGLGAVGYARGPPVVIPLENEIGPLRRAALSLARVRADLAEGLRTRMPGETGAFAAAVTVGDRAGISVESTEALRDANLSHLLAISGLHMGLVTALVFGGARFALAAVPYCARRWRTKRLAAVVAIVAAIAYLAISGASIATQRAFIMAAVALGAVILNRPAITLRALAVAALIILVFRPESLLHVGFQMSFAATAAIIAGFDYARAKGWSRRLADRSLRGKVVGYVLALAGTSLLAGLATAPFAAFHFNRAANYGLIANLIAVPTMGLWVAPSALIAAALAPFGLEGVALWAMGAGIETILATARFVASLDGAARPVSAAPPVVLTLIVLGGLGLTLGRKAPRAIGAVAVAAGVAMWLTAERPLTLIAPEGRLIGVVTEAGRAIDHKSAQSYAARIWLQRDGDEADQKAAAMREGFEGGRGGSSTVLPNGWRIVSILSKRPDPAAVASACVERTLLLAPRLSAPPEGACLALIGDEIVRLGAMAVSLDGDDILIVSAAERAGARLWTQQGAPR